MNPFDMLNTGTQPTDPTQAFMQMANSNPYATPTSTGFEGMSPSLNPSGVSAGVVSPVQALSMQNPMAPFFKGLQTPNNDFSNAQDSFWGAAYQRDAGGNVMQDALGQPLYQQGATNLDFLKSGLGVAQLGLNWFMDDRKLDVAEDQLGLQKQQYKDRRADEAKLDAAYSQYGKA